MEVGTEGIPAHSCTFPPTRLTLQGLKQPFKISLNVLFPSTPRVPAWLSTFADEHLAAAASALPALPIPLGIPPAPPPARSYLLGGRGGDSPGIRVGLHWSQFICFTKKNVSPKLENKARKEGTGE